MNDDPSITSSDDPLGSTRTSSRPSAASPATPVSARSGRVIRHANITANTIARNVPTSISTSAAITLRRHRSQRRVGGLLRKDHPVPTVDVVVSGDHGTVFWIGVAGVALLTCESIDDP